MKVLGIDTSNMPLGIALVDGDVVKGEFITNVKKRPFIPGDASH